VGALARDFSDSAGRWELVIDLFETGRQWTVSTSGDELIIRDSSDATIRSLTRGLPWASGVIEWILPWDVFGKEFNEMLAKPLPEKMQMIIRTSMPDQGYCDETSTFTWADGRKAT
jgi:hypothetical protein